MNFGKILLTLAALLATIVLGRAVLENPQSVRSPSGEARGDQRAVQQAPRQGKFPAMPRDSRTGDPQFFASTFVGDPKLAFTLAGERDAADGQLKKLSETNTLFLDNPVKVVVAGSLIVNGALVKFEVTKKGSPNVIATDSLKVPDGSSTQSFTTDKIVDPGVYTFTATIGNDPPAAVDIDLQRRTDTLSIAGASEGDYLWKTSSFPKLLIAQGGQAQPDINVTIAGTRIGQLVTVIDKNEKDAQKKVVGTAAALANAATTVVTLKKPLLYTGGTLIGQTSIGWSTSVTKDALQAPSADVKDPTITATINGKFAKAVSFPPAEALKLYDGYLHISGKRATPRGAIHFVVKVNDATQKGFYELAERATVSDNGDWEALLNLAQQKAFTLATNDTMIHELWVRAEDPSGKHMYAATSLSFKFLDNKALDAPTIVDPDKADAVTGVTKRFVTNLDSQTLQITVAQLDGARLLLFDEAAGDSPVAVVDTDASPVPVSLQKLANATHRFTAALARGNTIGPKSTPIELIVKKGGLRVQSVRPTTLGTAVGVRTVTIQFAPTNRLLDANAINVDNYVLRRSNGSGSFDIGSDTIVSSPLDGPITFDSATNSVALRFRNDLPVDIYQLEIVSVQYNSDGRPVPPPAPVAAAGGTTAGGATSARPTGIRDIFGNGLEDDNGTPITKYKIVLGKPADSADSPSDRPVTGQTGKYVEFPEYTPMRKPVDGINPSDRVETRVVRLYYFRDAHRVAQIVNRDVKSYNYQAVEVKRRLADKARDDANKLTDDRRAQERTAIEAARLTREAEAALKAAQDALNQARQNAAQAFQANQSLDVQIPALQQNADFKANALKLAQTDLGNNPTDPVARKNFEAALQDSRNADATLKQAQQQQNNAQTTLAAETTNLTTAQARIQTALADVQAKRAAEVAANEKAIALTAKEDRSREDQFRREVAAAHEDPDTYAPGKIISQDPVQQCSISVIGEGVIQLRGPIKGMNVIRTMINQIDAPVGQVRVAIHTAQVNGEHMDRMEKVVGGIQKYIDHSRFLTAQSAQMLRKAVVLVASRKAEMTYVTAPQGSQAARDQKYLYAFFGQDFIQELQTLDSEFLKTGNKLMSLHSMDSTSLSQALFLLALAKNSTRFEILDEFTRMTSQELPDAELAFLQAAGCSRDHKRFPLLALNAKFQSLRGFFNAEVQGEETMTPIQREFVRLAQIFKSQLITELELKQRVIERTIIEERFGESYEQQVKKQRAQEAAANAQLAEVQRQLLTQRGKVIQALALVLASSATFPDKAILYGEQYRKFLPEQDYASTLSAYLTTIAQIPGADDLLKKFGVNLEPANVGASSLIAIEKQPLVYAALARGEKFVVKKKGSPEGVQPKSEKVMLTEQEKDVRKAVLAVLKKRTINQYNDRINLIMTDDGKGSYYWAIESATDQEKWNRWVSNAISAANNLKWTVPPQLQQRYDNVVRLLNIVQKESAGNRYPTETTEHLGGMSVLHEVYRTLTEIAVARTPDAQQLLAAAHILQRELNDDRVSVPKMYEHWVRVQTLSIAIHTAELQASYRETLKPAEEGFQKLMQLDFTHRQAQKNAAENRRPLDHKKLLDMLIDEVEEKSIELLEGTRAHTANVDNYIKSISTALDDDFQTQFYLPAFRGVRESSNMWDVTFGQIETTSILANNRSFAKVTPQATMEFDLPKRAPAIAEALNSSKAMVQTFGGLLNDPTFLALAKMNGGQPTSSPATGAAGGFSVLRNVVPGLPSSTDERVLSQAGAGNRSLASPLEALIPDPAIYKFETGTGYEIRPVIGPDGQAVVFRFQYLYSTQIREPVRPDEKHLGRVKQHFIDTDVQLGNYELREISRYVVALKASRTGRGVPLLQDIPGVGVLFRPLPSAESSLQQNIIMGQATIFPTLFDLMGLRWAPAVADLDPLRTNNQEFTTRMRLQDLKNRTYDFTSSKVDEFLRIPPAERRTDLYRSQETIPYIHPNGYYGPGLNLKDSHMREGYDPTRMYPESRFIPGNDREGAPYRPLQPGYEGGMQEYYAPGLQIYPTPGLPPGALEPKQHDKKPQPSYYGPMPTPMGAVPMPTPMGAVPMPTSMGAVPMPTTPGGAGPGRWDWVASERRWRWISLLPPSAMPALPTSTPPMLPPATMPTPALPAIKTSPNVPPLPEIPVPSAGPALSSSPSIWTGRPPGNANPVSRASGSYYLGSRP